MAEFDPFLSEVELLNNAIREAKAARVSEAETVEEIKPFVEPELTAFEKQKLVVAELTTKLVESMNGRKESEIGLQEDYWNLRNQLNWANVRLEELR